MLKKSRKHVGKPTGRVTKAGRPVLKTPEGEERSEYSATIKLDNGKYINIPTIHNGKYYTEDELKKAVEDKRMIPTSEHDSFEEAIEAAKKRSKTLKQGGVLKAHQGTIVYNQGEQPSTAPTETEGLPNPFVTDPTTVPPMQTPTIKTDVPIGEAVKQPDTSIVEPAPISPLVDPAVLDNPYQPPQQMPTMPGIGLNEKPINMMPGFRGAGVDTTQPKVALGGGQLFPTQMPMPSKTAMPMPNVDQNKKQVEQTLLEFIKQSRQKAKEQEEIYNKERLDAMKNFNMRFHSGNLFPGMGSIIGKKMPFNEGGTVMEKQMEMNFGETPISQLAEGGMKDDGGEKDPVSGNDVPSGSLAKEVRDDVPAMVSEGEFIFPADVTRYIGLDKLMQLRQDAKMGLKKMEAMGQLGNPDDAELPDDIPFDAADIIIMGMDDEEVEEKNEGGIIGFQEGTADAGEQANQYYNIQKEGMKQYARKYVIYRNDAGQTIKVLSTANGSPIDTVPAGYKMVIDKDGLPATELPDMPEQKKPEVEQPTVQQRDDDNDTRDPMDIIKQGRESAKITADRLGMDVDEYINLPIKTRFNLLSEELNVMRGGTLDTEKRDAILAGAEGDSIFGGSLIGGVIDMIGSVFDKDNDGSMWTSTDKDGNVRNIFGQIIQTGVDVSKMGILKDGRWTGAATTTKKSKNKSSSGNLNQSLNTTSTQSAIGQSTRGRKADSDRYSAMAKSGYQGYQSPSKKPIRTETKTYDPVSGKTRTTGVKYQGPASRQSDNEDRREARIKQKEVRDRVKRDENKSYRGQRAIDAKVKQRDDNKKDEGLGAGIKRAKGSLITKPSTTKKPTKRKTLVQKKS